MLNEARPNSLLGLALGSTYTIRPAGGADSSTEPAELLCRSFFGRGSAPDGSACILRPHAPWMRLNGCVKLGGCKQLRRTLVNNAGRREWHVWDCTTNSLAGQVRRDALTSDDWAHFAMAGFNSSPRLCLTRMRADGGGQLAVLSSTCEQLAVSELLPGFTTDTRAYTASPDDLKLAGLAQSNHVLVVLSATSCETLVQV